jgi:3-hydroxyacyl-CoA dehydrogenase
MTISFNLIALRGQARTMRAVPVDENMAVIKKVGVIGAGQMGNGIAHVAAVAGFDVVLNDVSADRLKSGMATINGNLSRQVAKNVITEDAKTKALGRIALTESLEGLADCDLVIETAIEKEEVKRKLFHDLCAVLKPEAVIASNTSSISITRLASTTDRPERFIGIHFMNPVPLMKLGAHHPMGPLELADFIGLDTCLSIMQVLHEGLADSKYRPCPLLVKYVEAGWLGRKTQRGFYDYRGAKPVPTR